MANGKRKDDEELKQLLTTDVLGPKITIGRGQQVNKNLITNKQIEQELVRPNKRLQRLGLKGRSTTGPQLDDTLITKEKFKGPIEESQILPAVKNERRNQGPKQIGSSTLTQEGGVFKLVGKGLKPNTKGTLTSKSRIDFTRGSPEEVEAAREFRKRQLARNRGIGLKRRSSPFNILNFEGLENIFSTAGELAAKFASPKFQKQQAKARGKILAAKSQRENIKSIDSSIKSLSAALEKATLGEDENLIKELTGQLSEALEQRKQIVAGIKPRQGPIDFSSPVKFFTSLGNAFSDEDKEALTRRLFPNG